MNAKYIKKLLIQEAKQTSGEKRTETIENQIFVWYNIFKIMDKPYWRYFMKKKSLIKKGMAIALSAAMVLGVMPSIDVDLKEVKAASATVKDVNLGTTGIVNPTAVESTTPWTGSKVYFGLDTTNAIPKVNSANNTESLGTHTKPMDNNMWRVLDASTGLLLADGIIAERRYDDNSNDWSSSELYSWLNGDTYKTNSSKFSKLEQGAIATNADGDIRLLTINEVRKTEYGFTNDANANAARATNLGFWLRSPGERSSRILYVEVDGYVYLDDGGGVDSDGGMVRPAFNLTMDSVLFTIASGTAKSAFAVVEDSNKDINIWKLTLKDGNTGLAATRTDAGDLSAGTTVVVNVSSLGTAGTGVTYDTVSGMLTDANGTVLCYGKANESFGTGTGDYTFTIPDGVTGGAHFYVFAEDVSQTTTDITTTDYASNMVEPVYTAPAAPVKDINLGTAGFINPTSTGSDETPWGGSEVYYGDKLWHVLDPNHDSNGTEGGAFLFSDELQGTKVYNDPYKSITWEGCTLRQYMNGTDNEGGAGTLLGDSFTVKEQNAINTTTVQNPQNIYYSTSGGNSTDDKLFLLSLAEVQKVSYGFGSMTTRAASSGWWLRSPGMNDCNAASVGRVGAVDPVGGGVDTVGISVRPAFNLNLDSVLISSSSTVSKSSFSSVGTSGVAANTWKLTLKDASKTINIPSSQAVSQSGQTVTVPYTYTGSDVSQISIMITDRAYTDSNASILYYGALNTTLDSTGTGTFTLPTGLSEGYKIYMMAEDVNGETITDYASTPVEIVPIIAPPTYNITVQNDGNGTASANLTTAASGTKVALTATPKDGYQFKEWQVISSGVTITNNTFTMPASDVAIKAIFEKKSAGDDNKPTGPSIVGDNGTSGWEAITDKTTNAATGSTITVDMNGTTKVPGTVIDSIKGKDVNIVFDLGNGIKWVVNGQSVTKDGIGEIDFGVTTGTTAIPVDVVNQVTGEKYSIQISLAYNGEFGFKATLSINMDAKNAGYYANLYYYNKSTGKLEFMNAGKIDGDGNVNLTFTHASDYTIVVSDKIMDGSDKAVDTSSGAASTTTTQITTATATPKTGDNSPIVLWVLVLIGAGVGVKEVVSKRRKNVTR